VLDKFVEKERNIRIIAACCDGYRVYEGQTRYCVDLGKNNVHVKNRQ